jgi:hypothetical protein
MGYLWGLIVSQTSQSPLKLLTFGCLVTGAALWVGTKFTDSMMQEERVLLKRKRSVDEEVRHWCCSHASLALYLLSISLQGLHAHP